MRRQLRRLEPAWILTGLGLAVAAALIIHHWTTGRTPDRVALHIEALDFDIYWYGIWIIGGVALGAYVVSHLARQRGAALIARHVPASTVERPLADLALPAEVQRILARRRLRTVGGLLLQWGFDRRNLGLNEAGLDQVAKALTGQPGLEPAWLEEAPWGVWNPDHVWNGVIWSLVLGLIGARLYHVLTPSPSMAAMGIESPLDYLRHPQLIFDLRNGGLGIYGGLAGGALGMWLYTWRQRIPMLAWADLAVIGLALGQVFGRWGNYFNQELYGRPTDLPWAITIAPEYRLPAYSQYTHFHPAFLYESLWNLLTFSLLLLAWRRIGRRLLPGELMAGYLVSYGIGRTLLETVRLDSRTVSLGALDLNLAVATLVALAVAALAVLGVLLRRLRLRRDERGPNSPVAGGAGRP